MSLAGNVRPPYFDPMSAPRSRSSRRDRKVEEGSDVVVGAVEEMGIDCAKEDSLPDLSSV